MFVGVLATTVYNQKLAGNKAGGRISKRVFQENKVRQISEKQTFFSP